MKSQVKDMIVKQLEARGIRQPEVLKAMALVRRDHFLLGSLKARAYEDNPLPIACGQTISQPYIVALATELLQVGSADRVLEIGVGCGYQMAVLGAIVSEAYGVEWHPELAELAERNLRELGVRNAFVKQGDGKLGWKERAPFDGVLVSCAARQVPDAWRDQLKSGGRLVFPLETGTGQVLCRWVKGENEWISKGEFGAVRFVPLV